jgi:CDP-diacylglycerol--glycerol-3-phosphate 3-phosphatidyltransferase
MQVFPDRWNKDVPNYPTDRVFARLIAPLIPSSVLPNHLTVLRMLLVPLVVYFLYKEQYAIGVPFFLFVSLTDWFDGALARTRRQITEWGILYDPIADKLLIGSVLFVIVLQHINFVLGMCLLLVEFSFVLIGWYKRMHDAAIEPANVWGKVKMVAEVAGILLLLVALWSGIDLFVDLSNGTLAVALVAALVSVFWRIR